jgi:hypothetical protein
LGDSVHTRSNYDRNIGMGLQGGMITHLQLWNIPYYTTINFGIFAEHRNIKRDYYYTIYDPDTSYHLSQGQQKEPGYTIREFKTSQKKEQYTSEGWQLIPQLRVEIGVPLKLGNRILVTPKALASLIVYCDFGVGSPYPGDYLPESQGLGADGRISGAIQLSYRL